MHSYTIPTQLDTLKHHSDLPNRLQIDSVPDPYIYPLLHLLIKHHWLMMKLMQTPKVVETSQRQYIWSLCQSCTYHHYCLTNILKHSCIQVIASALAYPRPKVSAGCHAGFGRCSQADMQNWGATQLTYCRHIENKLQALWCDKRSCHDQ